MAAAALSCSEGSIAPPSYFEPNVILLDDPTGQLQASAASFLPGLEAVLESAERSLAVSGVTIRVGTDASETIAGYGAGGYTPDATHVYLHVDLNHTDLGAVYQDRLPLLMAHELHHAMRWRDPGYGKTLFEAMISEGMADHFAIETVGGSPPPWSSAFPSDSTAYYTDVARSEFDWEDYDHARWFFGTDPALPRWTGYTLGYRYVEAYLLAHAGTTAAGLVGAPASAFRPN